MDRNVPLLLTYHLKYGVALRKESVDRNSKILKIFEKSIESLSARRAWIEMLAPRLDDMSNACRSPQGERG